MKVTQIIDSINQNKSNVEFLPTGFSKLDIFLDGGFMRKELIVIGGQTGIGKSYLAGQIQYNIASTGFKTGYFSLEISNQMVVSRLIGALSNIKSTRIMAHHLGEHEEHSKIEAQAQLKAYDEYMDFFDNAYELVEIERQLVANKFDFIVIDFIQNIVIPGMDEYARLSFISIHLQRLAKKHNCTILILSQLSNAVAQQTDKTFPMYKGSGSIAMVADLGFYILRNQDTLEDYDLSLVLTKNRRGASNEAYKFNFRKPGGLIQEK